MMRAFTVKAPASTANLGPGLDAVALAFNLHCTLKFRILAENDLSVPLITLNGPNTGTLPTDKSNLVYNVLSGLWSGPPDILDRVRITIESEIPLGKGLGSSAAVIVAAVQAAAILNSQYNAKTYLCTAPANARPRKPEVTERDAQLAIANELEGHPDNVAASLFGGLVVCAPGHASITAEEATASARPSIITQQLKWPQAWRPVVIVPPYALSTKASRQVLPQSISRADAVYNLQRVALLLAAIANQDEEALQEALHDKLHEPYRESLVPELSQLRRQLSYFPLLGCVLSGAGPSVLTLVHERHKLELLNCLKNWANKQERPPEILDLQVDQEGLNFSYD